jgi:hypothetical protein
MITPIIESTQNDWAILRQIPISLMIIQKYCIQFYLGDEHSLSDEFYSTDPGTSNNLAKTFVDAMHLLIISANNGEVTNFKSRLEIVKHERFLILYDETAKWLRITDPCLHVVLNPKFGFSDKVSPVTAMYFSGAPSVRTLLITKAFKYNLDFASRCSIMLGPELSNTASELNMALILGPQVVDYFSLHCLSTVIDSLTPDDLLLAAVHICRTMSHDSIGLLVNPSESFLHSANYLAYFS